MNYSFQQVKTDNASLREIQTLLQLVFDKHADKFSLDYLHWQYAENPIGPIVGFNAYDGDMLVAHYVAMPIYMDIAGDKTLGLLSLNTATHPEHQGHRLFSTLADKTYQYATNQGFKFVIGVANANSTHGFLKNLGFTLVSPLKVRFGLGHETITKTFCYQRYWDENLLHWRLACPGATYYAKNNLLYSKRSLGRKDMMGLVTHQLKDSYELPRPMGHPISLYVGLGAELKGFMIKMPKFVKISPFNLIFKDLTKESLPKLTKDNILFQLMDFDVV